MVGLHSQIGVGVSCAQKSKDSSVYMLLLLTVFISRCTFVHSELHSDSISELSDNPQRLLEIVQSIEIKIIHVKQIGILYL